MRIGMMADLYVPYVSGVTTYINLTKRSLEKLGHEVFVFTFGDPKYADTEPNVFRSPGLPVRGQDIQMNFIHSPKNKKLIQTMDVVHIHHPYLSGRLAIRYCRPKNIPLLFTHHTRYDLYVRIYLPGFLEWLGEGFLRSYMPNFFKELTTLIVPSASMRQIAMEYGALCPIEVAPHGMDLQEFHLQGPCLQREELGFTSDQVVFIYVGRLGPEKNLPFLINAFHLTSLQHPEVRLLVVGDGPERKNLEELVESNNLSRQVVFTGLIQHSDLAPYYACADVFVTASTTETFGLTVVEAMASGLPVIGIDSPGVRDNIEHNQTGLVVSEKLDDFVAAMARLAQEKDFRLQLAGQSRQASYHYDIAQAAVRLTEIYDKALAIQHKESGAGG